MSQAPADMEDEARPEDIKSDLEVMTESPTENLCHELMTHVTDSWLILQVPAQWEDEARPEDIKYNTEVMTESRTDDWYHELMTDDFVTGACRLARWSTSWSHRIYFLSRTQEVWLQG